MRLKKDVREMAAMLAGMQTAGSIARALSIGKKTAVNYACRLRKLGLLETTRGAGKKRLYRIYAMKQPRKGIGLYAFISGRSKVKVVPRQEVYIYAELAAEGALVKAIESRDFRLILAALGLFSKVTNWPTLNLLAKNAKVQRRVGALYELAKKVMRVRHIDRRTLNSLRKGKDSERHIMPGLKSKDFGNLEKRWKVYIPFNSKDLEEYR
ncbi:MAG: hypothetical protein V1839_00195 [archaeon]